MSELEKEQRDTYQKRRKRRILIFSVIASLLALMTVFATVAFAILNKNTYVAYEEKGTVIYKAYLAENEFYEQEYLNGSHAYVASLIDHMTADFQYDLKMEASQVHYRYSYCVEATLEIKDKNSGLAIYNPTELLLPLTYRSSAETSLCVRDAVTLDYHRYQTLAQKFVDTYGLNDVSGALIVRMYVDVAKESDAFVSDSSNRYTIELTIPLLVPTVSPQMSTSVPTAEEKILVYATPAMAVFRILAIVCGTLTFLVIGSTVLFTILTRDKHIDYARKLQRILSNYRSYIQKICNPFDTSDYRKLCLADFSALLEIRDTVQSPILMYENEDKTCTEFFIPTPERLLYVFDLRVEEDGKPFLSHMRPPQYSKKTD